MRKPVRLLAMLGSLSAALAFILPAHADTTLTYTSSAGDFVVKVRPGAVRIDDASDRWQLYQADTGVIYSVEPKAQSYVKMDKAAAGAIRNQMQALREQMEAQLAQLTETQRAQARAMMLSQIPGLDGKEHTLSLEPTGGTDNVAGKPCKKIQVLRDGQPKETLCVATGEALGMSGKEFATIQSMFGLMQSMLAGTGLESIGLPYLSLDGMPIRYQDPTSGQTRTLKHVSHSKLPDLAFEIPTSYSAQTAAVGPKR